MQYLEYKGKLYDVGTKVRIKTRWNGIQEATFYGWGDWPFRGEKVTGQFYSFDADKYIVEIIDPVEIIVEQTDVNNRDCPPSWDVEIGWVWYIVIMGAGIIFKERLLIWVFATAIFFLWKNGFLNGGKK